MTNHFQLELSKLNPEQRAAVQQTEGPVLVLAGPGTGKTQLLSARIGNILETTDAQAHHILCLTYTDAGTIAMRKRLLSLIGTEAYRVHIHTFHSFCNMVIQEHLEYFGMRDLKAISELESIDLFYALVDDFSSEHPLKKYTGDIYSNVKRLRNLFDTMKKEHLSVETLQEHIDNYIQSLPELEEFQYKRAYKQFKKGDPKEKEIQEETERMLQLRAAVSEFTNYQQRMHDVGRYDFNDMIHWVIEAFQRNDTLLGRYQEQYLYILVDEFQDTNGSQSELLQLLTSYWDSPNLFVVGDDDQAIYSFQGAEIKRINEFVERYKHDLFAVVLERNYRSSQTILDAARHVIENNNRRLTKDVHLVEKLGPINKFLTACNPNITSTESNSVSVRAYHNHLHQEAGIVKEIYEAYAQNQSLSEVAIIYRSHRDIEGIIRAFDHLKIPYNTKRKVNILELPLVQNLITLLRYLHEETVYPGNGERYLFELMHYDFFGIEARDIAVIARECSRKKDDHQPSSWRALIASKHRMLNLGLSSASAISALEENISLWSKALYNETLQVVFEKIITYGNVIPYILKSEEKLWLMEVLNSFFDFIKEESVANPSIRIEDLLSTLDKMQKNDIAIALHKITHHEHGVHLLTAHSSKGLEFDTVYIINCVSDSWEKKRGANFNFKLPPSLVVADDGARVEEERRLFYVAITRAKRSLHICYPVMKLNDVSQDLATLERSLFVSEVLHDSLLEETQYQLSEEDLLRYTAQTITEAKIDGAILEKEFIQDVLNNYKLSVTHLNKYLKCPITFYFENILKVPSARTPSMGFGSAIHYAVERLFNTMLADAEKEFPSQEQFVYYFELGMKRYASHFTAAEYALKIEYAQQLLPEYHNEYAERWHKKSIVEYRINNASYKTIPLTGALDKIEITGNSCNVIDYKTGNPENAKEKLRTPSEKNPLGGDYWRQIIFYKILLDADKSNSWDMLSGEIDFVEKNKKKNEFNKVKIMVTPEDVQLVKTLIEDTYNNIMEQRFSPGCGKEDCSWCNFVKYNYKTTIPKATSEED